MKNFCSIFLLLCTTNLLAQQWLNCTNGFDVRDGIEQGEFLWLATNGGLVEKNTTTGKVKVYNRGNSPIPSNSVQSIAMDSENRIWISTNQGSAVFDGTDWLIFYEKSGLLRLDAQNRIVIAENDSLHTWNGQGFSSQLLDIAWYFLTDIAVNTENDDKWLSYYTFGIYNIQHYTSQGITIFNNQNSPLPFESAASNPILLDHQDRLWAGNSSGLFRYDGTDWLELSTTMPGLPAGNFSALDIDETGNVWAVVSTIDGKFLLGIFEDDTFVSYPLPNSFDIYAQIPFLKVSTTQESLFYLGTSMHGLWEFDLSDWKYVNTSQSELVSNSIDQIYIDKETTYLLGGQTQYFDPISLSAINESGWTVFNEFDNPSVSLAENFRGRVLGRHQDTLWIYSGDTLLAYVDGNWSLPQLPDLLNDVVELNSFSYHEPNGNRWLLEKYQSYIFYQTDQGWSIFKHEEHGAVSGEYNSYFTHPQTGDFWLASANGISHFNGSEWSIIKPKEHGLATNWVFELELDENGVVWGITRDAIFKMENKIPVIFATEINNEENLAFRSLEFDAQGQMWVGIENAIARLEGSGWIVLDNTNSGVPNGGINELEFDDRGNLWIGSSHGGFAVYNENGLPDFLIGDFHSATEQVIENEDDLLLFIYPNPIAKNSALTIELKRHFPIDKTSSISIYNTLGQLRLELPLSAHSATIPLHEIKTSGTYILEIKTGSKKVAKKIIIN